MARGRHRRWVTAAVLPAACLGPLTPAALGTARVSHGLVGGELTVRVDAVSGADGNHNLIVDPFVGGGRDGYRVRQALPGDPTIDSASFNCLRNPLFNDVVCDGTRGTVTITAGDGADTVILDQEPEEGVPSCAERPIPVVRAVLAMGAGDDGVVVAPLGPDPGCAVGTERASAVRFLLDARGEAGDDRLTGLDLDDVLDGGEDRDILTGGGGDDELNGGPGADTLDGGDRNDVLRGQGGPDTISGGPGTDGISGGPDDDVLRGGPGDDRFESGPGDDVIEGDAGTDTVNYLDALPLGVPVAATIGDDTSGDGPVGERDRIGGSVENVIGGRGPDAIIGSAAANELRGAPGNDTLRGAGGADRLRGEDGDDVLAGGPGGDSLDGGPGADRLLGQEDIDGYAGGAGDDSIDSRDGIREFVDCGPGADVADVDLQDIVPPLLAIGRCETVFRSPADDGPPGRVAGRRLRVDASGSARLIVVCPRGARVACRGTLTLRAVRGGRLVARGVYLIPVGRRAPVAVPFAGTLPRELVAVTRERGASRKGPRGARTVLTVVRR